MTQIIPLAHGSPDPRSGKAMRRFGEKIQSTTKIPTTVAFLDHEQPSLIEVMEHQVREDALVVPMLLSNAYHARFDVPKALREAGLHWALPPIGNPLGILRHFIQKTDSDVIVVAAGSSDGHARDVFKGAVKLASTGLNQRVDVAFATGLELTIESQLQNSENPSNVTVIPWLLAEGRLLDVILKHAKQHDTTVQGNGLVEEAAFVEYVCATIQLSLRSASYPQPTMAR